MTWQQQPGSLQELREMHEAQTAEMEAKGQDLRLAKLLIRVLDPMVPKGFRQFGFNQIAKAVGIDPNGRDAKGMINTLAGLDPQTLEGLRRGISQDLSSVEPGQITEVTKGLLTGSSPEKILGMISSATGPPSEAEEPPEQKVAMGDPRAAKGGKPFTHAPYGIGDAGFGYQGVPTEQPEEPLPPPGTPGGGPMMFPERSPQGAPPEGRGPFPEPMGLGGPTEEEATMVEGEGPALPAPKKTSPSMEEAPGEIPAMFGLEPGEYRIKDIRAAGYDRIPDNPVDLRKTLDDIKVSQKGVLDTLTMINQVAALARGHPEALDLPNGFNEAAWIETGVEFVKGLWNYTGFMKNPDDLDVIKYSPEVKDAASKATDFVMKYVFPINIVAGTFISADEIAQRRAQINAIMIPLGHTMARARQGPGVLTNQDVLFELEALGKSKSPDVFVAALEKSAQNIYEQYKQKTKVQTGKEVPVSHLATDDTIQAINQGGLVPKGLWEGLSPKIPGQTEELVDPSGVIKREVPLSEPTIKQEREQERKLVRQEAEWTQRQRGYAEERQAMARQQHAWAGEEAKRGEERLQMALRGEQRDIEREQRIARERRIEDIQKAFVELGRAFRVQPPSVGGTPSMPGQQAGAFQVGAIQRRTPPTIPDTIRRRTQGGR